MAKFDRDAYKALKDMLRKHGLGSLADDVKGWLIDGESAEAIDYLIKDTDAYKERFAGMERRRRAGYKAIKEGRYLELEDSYRREFQSAGLPKSFYDSPEDLAELIGNDLSVDEVRGRVAAVAEFVQSSDPSARQALEHYYGIDAGHLTAHYLNPKKGERLLQRQADVARLGAAADDQGLDMARKRDLEGYLDRGYDASRARQDYATVAELTPTLEGLGEVYGDAYDQTDAEEEVLGGLASAKRKREKLTQAESDTFSGRGGVGRDSLAPKAAGSY